MGALKQPVSYDCLGGTVSNNALCVCVCGLVSVCCLWLAVCVSVCVFFVHNNRYESFVQGAAS